MDFSLSEEQSILRNTVDSMLTDLYTFEQRDVALATSEGWRKEVWDQFAEMGLLAAPFSEEQGGLGGGAVETMIIMECIGKHLVVEPWLSSVLLAGRLLAVAGGEAAADALGGLMEGKGRPVLAWAEPESGFDPLDVSVRAEKKGGKYVVNGRKVAVMGAPMADSLLVSARTGSGISLFLVPKAACQSYRTVDGRMAGDVVLEEAEAVLVGEEGAAAPLMEEVFDYALAGLCAEASGAMHQLFDITMEYIRERKQFGMPLSTFQVLQHRMVDVFVLREEATSMTYMAVLKQEAGREERMWASSAAKAHVSEGARKLGEEAIQLHGGMGMTDELAAGHYFKRLFMIGVELGDAAFHRRRCEKVRAQVDRS